MRTGGVILIVAKSFSDNATGRVQVLWWLARSAGWQVKVVSLAPGSMWLPLRDSEFAASCEVVDEERLSSWIKSADLVIAAKPFDETLGAAIRLRRREYFPLIVDVDDPDIEVRFPVHHPTKLIARLLTSPKVAIRAARLGRLVRTLPTLVSNPVLQRWHGGTVMPHVRPDPGSGVIHSSEKPSVVFVGTNRAHKGVGILREAVDMLSGLGYTLTVTDTAPADAKPWERWVGSTSTEAGKDLVKNADIVVIPSMPGHTTSEAQLPAKLIDAMLAARAIVVSDFEPLTWALSGSGLTVRAGSAKALASALLSLKSPAERSRLGAAARTRALETFTLEAQRDAFADLCSRVVASGPRAIGPAGQVGDSV